MADEIVEELVISTKIDADGFKEDAQKVEDALTGIEKKVKETGKKTGKDSKKVKDGVEAIGDETKKADGAFKKGKKSATPFFSSMAKGVIGFAASIFTLSNAISATVKSAERLADISTSAREIGVTPASLQSYRNAEEVFNIPKGTYEGGVRAIQALQGKYFTLREAPTNLAPLLLETGISWSDFIKGDKVNVLNKVLSGLQGKDLSTRNAIGGMLGVSPLTSLSSKDYSDFNAEIARNQSINDKRSDVYEQSSAERKEYIRALQEFSRSLDTFSLKVLPFLTAVIEFASHPLDNVVGGFKKAYKAITDLHNPENRFSDSDEKADFIDIYRATHSFGVPNDKIPENATKRQLRDLAIKYYQEKQVLENSSAFNLISNSATNLPPSGNASSSVIITQNNTINTTETAAAVKRGLSNAIPSNNLATVVAV